MPHPRQALRHGKHTRGYHLDLPVREHQKLREKKTHKKHTCVSARRQCAEDKLLSNHSLYTTVTVEFAL